MSSPAPGPAEPAHPPFGVFDAERPPDPRLVDECVHCGFCLTACPTYALWGEEMDSPRGRIHLLKVGLAGEVTLDRTYLMHFDRCLGCLACVPACPSGVQYEPLVNAARAQLERRGLRSAPERWLRAVLVAVLGSRPLLRLGGLLGWVYRALGLRWLLAASRLRGLLPGSLAALERLLPPTRLGDLTAGLPRETPARGARRQRVGLLAGCVQAVFFREANLATLRVLAAEGFETAVPAAGCCGALALHSGADARARAQVRSLIAAFEAAGVDRVVVNAAGCGSHLKHVGQLLADDPVWAGRAAAFADRVVDVLELLDAAEPTAPRGPIPARVAYHDACHLAHGQGLREAPRRVLRAIPGLDLVEVPEGELCCGSAGLYNILQPDAARALGERKAANLRGLAPAIVAAANPGCLLQLAQHLEGVELVHPVELVDRSIRGADGAATRGL